MYKYIKCVLLIFFSSYRMIMSLLFIITKYARTEQSGIVLKLFIFAIIISRLDIILLITCLLNKWINEWTCNIDLKKMITRLNTTWSNAGSKKAAQYRKSIDWQQSIIQVILQNISYEKTICMTQVLTNASENWGKWASIPLFPKRKYKQE